MKFITDSKRLILGPIVDYDCLEHEDGITINRIVGQNRSLYMWNIMTVNSLTDI